MSEVKIDNCIKAIQEPVSKMISEIIKITDDGKVNLKDIDNLINVVMQLYTLRELTPEIKEELNSLNKEEFKLLASEIAGITYDKYLEVSK